MMNPASLPPNVLQALRWLATQPGFGRMLTSGAGAPSLQSPFQQNPAASPAPTTGNPDFTGQPTPINGILSRLFGGGPAGNLDPSQLLNSQTPTTGGSRPSFRWVPNQNPVPVDPTLGALFGTGDVSRLSPGDLTAAAGRQASANQSVNPY